MRDDGKQHRNCNHKKGEQPPGAWLAALVMCVVMAISATWELFEWLSAVIGGSSADDFLGTQGDVWDTQWDMFCAGIGAATSLLLLTRLHDRQLRNTAYGTHPQLNDNRR